MNNYKSFNEQFTRDVSLLVNTEEIRYLREENRSLANKYLTLQHSYDVLYHRWENLLREYTRFSQSHYNRLFEYTLVVGGIVLAGFLVHNNGSNESNTITNE
jgi:hypothetical protein